MGGSSGKRTRSPSVDRRPTRTPTDTTMRTLLSLLSFAAAAAFQVGIAPAVKAPLRSAAAPTMLAPEAAMALATFPTTMLAEDNTILLASGGLIGFFFVFAVVATIVINFGIMKK